MMEQKGKRSDVSDPESSMDQSKIKTRVGGGITSGYQKLLIKGGVFKEFVFNPSVYISMIGQTSLNYTYTTVNQERFRNVLFKGVNRSQFMAETTELSLEPTSWLKTSFSWSTARQESIVSGDEFYNGHIFRNVTTVQFTRKLFVRGIGEYNTFSNSFNIYPLVSYKFNAFTMFCAGMTQDYQQYNLDESNFYKTTGHQYFVKLQYLFNL